MMSLQSVQQQAGGAAPLSSCCTIVHLRPENPVLPPGNVTAGAAANAAGRKPRRDSPPGMSLRAAKLAHGHCPATSLLSLLFLAIALPLTGLPG